MKKYTFLIFFLYSYCFCQNDTWSPSGNLNGKDIANLSFETYKKSLEDKYPTQTPTPQTTTSQTKGEEKTDFIKDLEQKIAKSNQRVQKLISEDRDSRYAFGKPLEYKPEKYSFSGNNATYINQNETENNSNSSSSVQIQNENLNHSESEQIQSVNLSSSESEEIQNKNSTSSEKNNSILNTILKIIGIIVGWFVIGFMINFLFYSGEPQTNFGKNQTAKTAHIIINILAVILIIKTAFL